LEFREKRKGQTSFGPRGLSNHSVSSQTGGL
jgi:hypothetical protein